MWSVSLTDLIVYFKMDDEVIEYLNQNFGTLESMAGLEKAILDFDLEIYCVDTEIKNVIREQALAAE